MDVCVCVCVCVCVTDSTAHMRKPQPERLHTESTFGLLLRGVAARESAFAPLTHSLIDAMRVRNCASTSTMEGLQEDNEGAGSLLGPDMAQSALCSFRSDVPYDRHSK